MRYRRNIPNPIFPNYLLSTLILLLSVHCLAEPVHITSTASGELPKIQFPKSSIEADELGILVNERDPQSIEIGNYYASKRKIPSKNIFGISFTPGRTSINVAEFESIRKHLEEVVPNQIQALVLTWTLPFKVKCMSITSAFALGFDEKYCAQGCKPTKKVPYFESNSVAPYTDYKIRPTIMLAGENIEQIKALIQRGINADNTYPKGSGYLVKTSDRARNTRSYTYERLQEYTSNTFNMDVVNAEFIESKTDVLFYFTGASVVPHLSDNRYLPGAITDHLTSFGGVLSGTGQMSVLEWLKAGATGSYGTVVEPCNFPQKFPNPGVVVTRYLFGETLIEAYWKSVEMPGQGLFVGEPLAKPFGGYIYDKKQRQITTYTLKPGNYLLETAKEGVGPYRVRRKIVKKRYGIERIKLEKEEEYIKYYRMRRDTRYHLASQ
jgi:uncharacterized protein (TIGR03790 family)